MYLGPLDPVSIEAITGMDKVSRILEKVPRKEWGFVLKQAKDIASARLVTKMLARLSKIYSGK